MASGVGIVKTEPEICSWHLTLSLAGNARCSGTFLPQPQLSTPRCRRQRRLAAPRRLQVAALQRSPQPTAPGRAEAPATETAKAVTVRIR